MVDSFWAQSLQVSWTPRLSYLERRTRFAAELERGGLTVHAFRIEPDQMAVRLGGAFDELTLSSTGFSYDSASRDFDEEIAAQAIDLLISLIEPEEIIVRSVAFQYLSPIESRTYDEARQVGVGAFLGDWAQDSDVVDYALLIDGDVQGVGAYQIEFGIVESVEIKARLTRAVGRTSQTQRALPPGWDDPGLPEVAIFSDIRWSSLGSGLLDNNLTDQILDLWRSTGDASSGLIQRLEQSYLAADS